MLVIQSAEAEQAPRDQIRGQISLAPFYDGAIAQLTAHELKHEADALLIGIKKRCPWLLQDHTEFRLSVDPEHHEIVMQVGKPFPPEIISLIQMGSQSLARQHEMGGHDNYLLKNAGQQLCTHAVNMMEAVTAELKACNLVIDY
ncbi:hypothetical protein GC177_09590 [bacterium]|nr:hypothetical protein [bacterium]